MLDIMLIMGQSALQSASAHLQHASHQHRSCPLHISARPVTGSQGYVGRADRLRARAAQTDAQLRDRLGENSGVVTDQAVPEGHKGLHGFLYGEGGAEAHDSESQYQFREVLVALSFLCSCSPEACCHTCDGLFQGQDDGTSCLSVEEYLQTRDGERPLGVYALYDAHNHVQYVGYSRNMVIAVKVLYQILMPVCLCVLVCVSARQAQI